MEQMDYNLLFRWFVGLSIDDCGLGRVDLFEESRSAFGGRRCAGVPGHLAFASKGQAASVERSLLGGWNVAQVLGPR